MNVQPGVIGTIVAVTFNVMIETFDYARVLLVIWSIGVELQKNLIISGSSLVGGTIAVAVLPFANALSFATGAWQEV